MSNVHELKTDPEVFDAVWRGDKTHEIRLNDRDYRVGDSVFLRETKYTGEQMRYSRGACSPIPLIYTGRELMRKITHILSGYGLEDNWVILSLAPTQGADDTQVVIAGLNALLHDAQDEIARLTAAQGADARPVAWMYSSSRGTDVTIKRFDETIRSMCPPDLVETPLYVNPALRSGGEQVAIYQINEGLVSSGARWRDVDEKSYLHLTTKRSYMGRIVYATRDAAPSDVQDAARYQYLKRAGVIVDWGHVGPWQFGGAIDAEIDKWIAATAPREKT